MTPLGSLRESPRTRAMVAIVIVALASGGFYAVNRSDGAGQASAPGTTEVEREAVVALARLEPDGRIRHLGLGVGDRLESLYVAEGERVSAGQLLATGRQYAIARAEHAAVLSRLREAEAQFAAERAFRSAAIEQARLQLRTAEAEEVLARQDGVRESTLFERGLSSDQAKQIADRRLEEAELETARANIRLRLAEAERDRALAAVPVASLREELTLVQARVDAAAIRAPADGQVLKIHVWPGESVSGRSVLQFGGTQQMYAVAEVYETEIGLVRAGQQVRLTSSALPAALHGVVEDAGLIIYRNDIFGDDPSAPVDGRVFQVRIRLEDSSIAARYTNHEVEARILLGNAGGQ